MRWGCASVGAVCRPSFRGGWRAEAHLEARGRGGSPFGSKGAGRNPQESSAKPSPPPGWPGKALPANSRLPLPWLHPIATIVVVRCNRRAGRTRWGCASVDTVCRLFCRGGWRAEAHLEARGRGVPRGNHRPSPPRRRVGRGRLYLPIPGCPCLGYIQLPRSWQLGVIGGQGGRDGAAHLLVPFAGFLAEVGGGRKPIWKQVGGAEPAGIIGQALPVVGLAGEGTPRQLPAALDLITSNCHDRGN